MGGAADRHRWRVVLPRELPVPVWLVCPRPRAPRIRETQVDRLVLSHLRCVGDGVCKSLLARAGTATSDWIVAPAAVTRMHRGRSGAIDPELGA